MSTSRPGNRDPRYRPSPSASGGWPAVPPRAARTPSPAEVRWAQLAEHPGCQWQARGVRCVAEAVEVVLSREGVPRSTCLADLPRWLRAGGRRLIADPGLHERG